MLFLHSLSLSLDAESREMFCSGWPLLTLVMGQGPAFTLLMPKVHPSLRLSNARVILPVLVGRLYQEVMFLFLLESSEWPPLAQTAPVATAPGWSRRHIELQAYVENQEPSDGPQFMGVSEAPVSSSASRSRP